MKLKKLIADLPIEIYRGGAKDVEITGLSSHSKSVYPGNLFIAKRGSVDDGAKYIEEALVGGAVAILTDLPNPFLKDVVQLIHPNVKQIEPHLAQKFYALPSQPFLNIGVTGTNGKTTITHLIKHLLDCLGTSCGMIGTIEYVIGESRFEAGLTTPDVITNHKLIREMKRRGCSAVVMEVSSIGIDQERISHIDFDIAVFSNLSQDHLDYHKTMDIYAKAKKKLFSSLSPDKFAIMNAESPWTSSLLEECKANVLTYGLTEAADLFAHDLQLDANQSQFSVTYRDETARVSLPQIGRFNVLNGLAAIGACLTRGFSLADITAHLPTFPSVAGRLQRVENLNGWKIFVDYAHTPDALEKTLRSLQEIKEGRLICIFGCGGDRDRGKRPQMGEIAGQYADFSWITSDNPRSENPHAICEEVASGFRSKDRFIVEVDRERAIQRAIESASLKDLILIAGKGHETYQIFSNRTVPFDDQKIAQKIANSHP